MIKKYILSFLFLLGLSGAMRADSVTILIDAGLLENSTGTAAVPVGGLLQLIASPSGTFSAPTSASYVSGNNTLVASFAMNYSSSTVGETVNGFDNLALTANITAGEELLLRFYPSLTYASMPAAPTLATTYGQVRSDTIEFGPLGGDPNETPWVVPAAGGSAHLDYITVSDNGTYANTSAYSTNIVLAGTVPEPSTYSFFAAASVGMISLLSYKRRSKAS